MKVLIRGILLLHNCHAKTPSCMLTRYADNALGRLSTHGAFDQPIGIRLRGIDLGVLAGVLETMMPAQV